MVLADAPADAIELQPHDAAQHLVRQRIIGNRHDAPEQRRREHLQQFGPQRLRQRLGILAIFRIGRQPHDQVGADIGGQDDQRVLEVDPPAVAVLHDALVEHLEEDLVHVGMRLLDLVEQNDAVGLAPHRLGEPAALAIADIAGRRALERGDRVRLLEFRHVDGDHVLLAAIERLGERERGLGLADAGRAAQHEHADRLVGIVELGAVGLDALGDHRQAVRLADDAPVEDFRQPEDVLDLVLHHAADRNAGPVGDDRGDHLFVDMGVDHPLFRIAPFERLELLAQLACAPPPCRMHRTAAGSAAAARQPAALRPADLPLPSACFGGD